MKKFFVMSILLIAAMSFAKAQQGGGFQNMTAEQIAERQDTRLTELLTGLTTDQKAKLKVVNLELAKEQVKIRQDNQNNREAMREAIQKLETKREAKYKEILTADQLKKYTDDRAQRQQRQRNN